MGKVRCLGGHCFCQRFRIAVRDWPWVSDTARAAALRDQTGCEAVGAVCSSGLLAYLGDDPVGWCAVDRRTATPGLFKSQVPRAGRAEDKADPHIWAITCMIIRPGFRRRGFTTALAQAAVAQARDQGALALEAYAMLNPGGADLPWGEMHVGSPRAYAVAGMTEVAHPTPSRVVMRIKFRDRAYSGLTLI